MIIICKFCENESAQGITYNRPPDWGCCSECAVLVMKKEFSHLYLRMLNRYIAEHSGDVTHLGIDAVKELVRNILSEFMEGRDLVPLL